jgi:hypothetical protein
VRAPFGAPRRIKCKARVARAQAAALHGSFDVFMLNFYTSKYVYYLQGGWGMAGQGVIDAADTFNATNGTSIGPETASSWFKEVPWAFRKQLKWVSDRCAPRPGLTAPNFC